MGVCDFVFVMRRPPPLVAAFLLLLLPSFFTFQYAGRGVGGGGGGGDRRVVVGGGGGGGESRRRAGSISEYEDESIARHAEEDDRLRHAIRRLFHFPEAAEGRLLQGYGTSSISRTDTNLLVEAESVVTFPGQSPFETFMNGTLICVGGINDIVLSSDGSVLYYRLLEACMDTVLKEITKLRYSFRVAKLGGMGNVNGAVNGSGNAAADEGLLTYWWPAANASGSANKTAYVELDPFGTGLSNPMTYFAGNMDITKSGKYLALFPTTFAIGKKPIVFLDVVSGDRLIVPVSNVDSPGNLAFTRGGDDRLFIADSASPCRILSAPMLSSSAAIFLPMDESALFEQEALFSKTGKHNITDTKFAGQSLDSNGSCLYFSDSNNLTLWSLNLKLGSPPSADERVTHVAGSGKAATLDGPFLSASFESLSHPVVTRDGCNVFVADGSVLRWIKLTSPCSKALDVASVASGVTTTFMSLTLFDNGTGDPHLYLGTMDSQVHKLTISRAALHKCSSSPLPDIISAPPSSSRSPPSSTDLASLSSSSPPPSSSTPPPPPPPAPSSNGTSPPSPPAPQSSSSSSFPVIIVVPVVCGVAILIVIVGVAICYCRRSNASPRELAAVPQSTTNIPSSLIATDAVSLHPAIVRAVPLTELRFCTNNFDKTYLIGDRGAFGEVYWGSLGNEEVAIKVMHGELTAAKRRQFVAEVNTLSRLHHANLIELKGYCDEGSRCILVYPYFAGGSLHSRLHKRVGPRGGGAPLTLWQRLSIIVQIAEGLRYLHCGANPRVIHRDVKSSNVLLSDAPDGSLRVVLADFGTAAIAQNVFEGGHESMVKTSQLAGTRGYIAPEYLLRGRLTAKNDVFAFGIVILELLTGKPAILHKNPVDGEFQTLAEWIRAFSQHANMSAMLATIIDRDLRSVVDTNVIMRNIVVDVINLGIACSHAEDELRPIMSSVCDRLTVILSEAKGRGI